MSDESDGWGYVDLGRDRIPTHCGGQALDLDLGEWECRHCDATVHVRQIPGWHDRATAG